MKTEKSKLKTQKQQLNISAVIGRSEQLKNQSARDCKYLILICQKPKEEYGLLTYCGFGNEKHQKINTFLFGNEKDNKGKYVQLPKLYTMKEANQYIKEYKKTDDAFNKRFEDKTMHTHYEYTLVPVCGGD